MTYRRSIQRYTPAYSTRVENINLNIKNTSEIHLTHDEAKIINSLRGLHGKKAQFAMFKIFVENCGYTYDQLLECFPVYQTSRTSFH